MSQAEELFEQAVQAAQAGERERALGLFLAYVEQVETNPEAWMWLSRLVSSPADREIALENALDLTAPGSEAAREIQARLEKLRESEETLSGPALVPAEEQPALSRVQDLYQQALHLRDTGLYLEAIELLQAVVAADPGHEQAWLVLSEIYVQPAEKIQALEKALAVNPGNHDAKLRLDELRLMQENPMRRGEYLEAKGDQELAVMVYTEVLTHSRLPAERLEARRRIEAIRMRQEVDQIQRVNPTTNLLRLTFGPVVLFAIMILMQSGLNPLRAPLLAYLGLLSVVAGSFLISITGMRPAHPRWIEIVGTPGTGDEREMRRGLRLLGLVLLLAPFLIFLIEAGNRLALLRSLLLAQ